MTETWLSLGDTTALMELSPPDYSFFNSPRTAGRGGGIATIFRNCFKCKRLPDEIFHSFEVQLFKVDFPTSLLCALVYRPLKYNKDFIQEFSDFLASLVSRSDSLLIVGDFNIHVCCHSKPLVKEFSCLMDSLNFIQSVTGPTHQKGHTLDLVFSRGFPVNNLDLCDAVISDHCPVIFDSVLSCTLPKSYHPPRYFRCFNSSTAKSFNDVYISTLIPTAVNVLSSSVHPDELVELLNSTCTSTLDSVAPLRLQRSKMMKKAQPWLQGPVRAIRQECRRAERSWKKNKLQISYEIFRDCLKRYQSAAKEAQGKYMSDIIAQNADRPKILFNTINAFLNPVPSASLEFSTDLCEQFLKHFIHKVEGIRSNIPFQNSLPLEMVSHRSSLSLFQPMSPSQLYDIVLSMKPSFCHSDVLPSQIFKEVFPALSPVVTAIINNSLTNGIVPASFKHAIVQPLLKKHHLDQHNLNNYRPISKLSFISKVLEKISSVI
ncbi:uncharacterized protein LOC131553157 [Onychostoma macrolepis]|uniref:uncharacterized protein LOC131553157 n=1 Tax=Onychostoma macrolepis TaxID=369639 RepID=UPI00272CA47C|nr:uncharacterized protein LOC131553157 [Onychostoma macrolepis]